jgi:hypothetical protein
MGWPEGANMRLLLTLTLDMETANSPKTGHCHTVQKTQIVSSLTMIHHESLKLVYGYSVGYYVLWSLRLGI